MGVSFKVSKTGTRYCSKPPLQPEVNDDVLVVDDVSENNSKESLRKLQVRKKRLRVVN
jgi:hypothetical protein